jgi:[acyl-carrier-protein] S-malonyltransferase
VGNVAGEILRSAADLRQDLKAQLTSRVRWTESVQRMLAAGIVTFAEVGAGEVLLGLIRRIDRSASLIALDRPESLDAFLA